MNANTLHNNQIDCWQDWQCNAGHTRIYIKSNLDVYGGECLNDYLGRLDQDWQLLPESTVCKRTRCTGCTDDLLTPKRKNNDS